RLPARPEIPSDRVVLERFSLACPGWHWWLAHQCLAPGPGALVDQPPVPPRKGRYEHPRTAIAAERHPAPHLRPPRAIAPPLLVPTSSALVSRDQFSESAASAATCPVVRFPPSQPGGPNPTTFLT